jgi:hypothetical protein
LAAAGGGVERSVWDVVRGREEARRPRRGGGASARPRLSTMKVWGERKIDGTVGVGDE